MKLKLRTFKSFRDYQQWIVIYKNGVSVYRELDTFDGKFATRKFYHNYSLSVLPFISGAYNNIAFHLMNY